MTSRMVYPRNEINVLRTKLRVSFQLLATLLFSLVLQLLPLGAQNICSCTDCPKAIVDFDTISSGLLVKGALQNELSTPTQGVCRVCVKFRHDLVSDTRIELFSPSGQSITLVAPVGQQSLSALSEWDVCFAPCSSTATPDPGLPAQWSGTGWGGSGNYNGTYYPNSGCLEDFNSGPVNGTWSLRIIDGDKIQSGTLLDWSIEFCEPFGLECLTCDANPGSFSTYPAVTGCQGADHLNLSIPPIYTPANQAPPPLYYGFAFIVSQNDTIRRIQPTADLRSLSAGNYDICGISYRLIDSANLPVPDGKLTLSDLKTQLNNSSSTFCAAISSSCVPVTVYANPVTNISANACRCYVLNGIQYCQSGDYQQQFKTINGCDSTVNISVTIVLAKMVRIDAETCEGQPYLFCNKKVFSEGLHRDTLTAADGCDSIVTLNLTLKFPKADTTIQYICHDSPLQEGFSTDYLVASNGCDSLHTTSIVRLEEKIFELTAKVCRLQGIRVGGSFFDRDTSATIVIPNVGPAGCDSTVYLELSVVDSLVEFKNIQLCNEESYTYNNITYRKPALVRNIFTKPFQCDSIYYLVIDVYACKMRYKLSAKNVSCDRTDNGAIGIEMQDSSYINYFYTWQNLSNGVVSSTFLIAGDQNAEIGSLPAGKYLVKFENGAGLFQSDTIIIEKSEPLSVSATVSNYKGTAINCFGDRNGSIQLSPSGGDPPYRFVWSDGNTSESRKGLHAGRYAVTVSDMRNCIGIYDTLLIEPGKISARINLKNPLCHGGSDGMIKLDSVANVLFPLRFSLNGAAAQSFSSFLNLSADSYKIKITDDRNCTLDTTVVLNEPAPISVDAGTDATINFGESVTLRGSTSLPLSDISKVLWNNVQDVNCTNCLEKKVAPSRSTRFILTVFDKNNCSGEDFTSVTVKDLQFFIPNAFSPNDDGFNDYFTVFGDPNSFSIKTMSIYNRWGDLVFVANDLLPGDEQRGWNGKFKGLVQSDGMYVYSIELELSGKSTRNLKGEVFLLK